MPNLGSFLLVPFLVSVFTGQPGLAGFSPAKASQPLAANHGYVPLALAWRAGVQRTIEAPSHSGAEPTAVAWPTVARLCRAPAGQVQAVIPSDPGLLYVLMSLRI